MAAPTIPSTPKIKLLILDDSQLLAASRRPEVTERFPFLRTVVQSAAKTGGCGGCGGKKASNVNQFASIRRSIDQLSSTDKGVLKQMLNAERIRVYYPDARNQQVKSTF